MLRKSPRVPRQCRRDRRVRRRSLESLERRDFMSADAVMDWNAVALQAVANDHTPAVVSQPDQGGPTRSARALAIVHAAMFDAVNAIDKSYTSLFVNVQVPSYVSIDAAASQAAYSTLVALFPQQKAMFNQALRTSLDAIPDGISEFLGVALGKYAANRMLEARKNDGSELAATYVPGTQPGDHRPDPINPNQGFLTPDWGMVKPFTMGSATDFEAPAPPGLTSAEYAAAFNEVKSLGGDGVNTATQRTAEQTEIGIYWAYDGTPKLGTPPRLYNQIARVVADQEGNTEIENARMFALVNMAMADAACSAWNTKYTYNFWRPILGIREADAGTGPSGLGDGNPATAGDPTWTPLGAPASNQGGNNFTPPFPAYVSGHAIFGAASFKTLANFYGRDDIHFSFTSDELNGVTTDAHGVVRPLVTRSFDSFSEAAAENAQSRIYLGIHWAFDASEGVNAGNAIADHMFSTMLTPRSQPPGTPLPIPPGVRNFLSSVGAGIGRGLASALGGTLLVDPQHFQVGFGLILASGMQRGPSFQLFAPDATVNAAASTSQTQSAAQGAATPAPAQQTQSLNQSLSFGLASLLSSRRSSSSTIPAHVDAAFGSF